MTPGNPSTGESLALFFDISLRPTTTAALAALTLWATSLPADAASVCARLRDKLSSATETIGNTAEVRAYARAAAQQNQEILKVRADIRRYGCSSGSFIVIGGPNARTCDTLTSTLSRMQQNLSALKDHQSNLTTKSLSDSSRARILNALEANGCNDIEDDPPETASRTLPPVNASFSQIETETPQPPENYSIRNIGGAGQTGSLQTVCVRTCDGGFFPISSNAGTSSFTRDAQVCSMMCPGVSTQLFYHSVGTQETGDMISAVNGKPYGEQSFAYKYRNASSVRDKSCSCNFSAYYREMMRREAGKVTTASRDETYSGITDLTTGMELRKTEAKPVNIRKRPAKPYDPSSQHVRQVGPAFFPEEGTIDLHDPEKAAD